MIETSCIQTITLLYIYLYIWGLDFRLNNINFYQFLSFIICIDLNHHCHYYWTSESLLTLWECTQGSDITNKWVVYFIIEKRKRKRKRKRRGRGKGTRRERAEKKEKTKKKKIIGSKESDRKMGDLVWRKDGGKIRREDKKAGTRKVLQVNPCVWQES